MDAIIDSLDLLRRLAVDAQRETSAKRRTRLAEIIREGAQDVARMAEIESRVVDQTTGFLGMEGQFACYRVSL